MMQEISIRPMQTADAEAVNVLTGQLGYVMVIEQARRNIETLLSDSNAAAFVAVFDNRIVGWITVAGIVTLESAPYCEIRGLIVDEQLRNKKLAKRLLKKQKNGAGVKTAKD